MPSQAPRYAHDQHELRAYVVELGILRANEVTVQEGEGTLGSVYFDDQSGVRQTVQFDLGMVNATTAGRIVHEVTSMYYSKTAAEGTERLTIYRR